MTRLRSGRTRPHKVSRDPRVERCRERLIGRGPSRDRELGRAAGPFESSKNLDAVLRCVLPSRRAEIDEVGGTFHGPPLIR